MMKITIGMLRRIIKEELAGASRTLQSLNTDLGGEKEDLEKSNTRAFLRQKYTLDHTNSKDIRAAGQLGELYHNLQSVASNQKGVKGLGGSNYWYTLHADYRSGNQVYDFALIEHNSYNSNKNLIAYSKDGKTFGKDRFGSFKEMTGNWQTWDIAK